MTTAYPSGAPPPVPGRWGYVVAGLLLVATIVGATILGAGAVRGFAQGFSVKPVAADGQFTIGREPVAVYVDGSAGQRTCTATPVGGGPAMELRPRDGAVSVEAGGHHWERVGATPEGKTPGVYLLRCRPDASAVYGTGRLFPTRQILLGSAGAVLVAIVGLSLAGLLGVVTLLRRSNGRTRAAAAAYVPPRGRR